MTELIIANIVFSILFLVYVLILRELTFFRVNRAYLVLSLVLSSLIPFISFDSVSVGLVTSDVVTLPTVVLAEAVATAPSTINWIMVMYWAGVALSGVLMLVGFIRLFRKTYTKHTNGSEDYLITPGTHAYSFFNRIHIGSELPSEMRQMICEHEKVHTIGFHSLDVLLFSIAKVICWFNPFIYWGFKELKLNHEYIADESTYRKYGTDYQYSILNQALDTQVFQLSNSFYSKSLIKKRIVMMNKTKSGSRSVLRYALLIPTLVLTVWIAACNQQPGVPVQAQTETSMNEIMKPSSDVKIAKEVDVIPQFPGGQEGMLNFFKEGFTYPEELKEDNVEGRVAIGFVVHEDGSTTDFEPVESDDERLEAPAIEFLKNMPAWEPGSIDGEPVKVKMVLPVQYTMN